jgi:hypothetical protein
MIDAIIRGMLGEAGSAVLDLYLEHAFWINAILLLYALMLLVAKQGHRKVISAIKSAMLDKFGQEIENKNENWYKKVLEKNGLDWEEIAQQTWIPIISTNGTLGFRIKTPGRLKNIFTPEKIYKAITDAQ